MLRHMISITPIDNYRLVAEYADGEKRVRSMLPLMDKGVFKLLRNPAFFKTVRLVYGAPTWIAPDGYEIDLCPDAFYAASQPYGGDNQ